MKKIIKECCDCAVPAYPCIGDSCHRQHVPHWYCDICEEEFSPDELYDFDGKDFCKECLLTQFQTVEEMEKNA